jgi:hypothetical protein
MWPGQLQPQRFMDRCSTDYDQMGLIPESNAVISERGVGHKLSV